STTEIAKGVVYLASEDAAYITGSTLTIDGGATLPVVAANDFV
ncbi:MAG: SDR family oxidoreductase, partial [Spirochaetales bacterium]|nr:SDR family oxidoreductase [Spirochaetales bacterium]